MSTTNNTNTDTTLEDPSVIDRQTEAQLAAIAAQVKETQPLTGELRPMDIYWKERIAKEDENSHTAAAATTVDNTATATTATGMDDATTVDDATSHFAAGCQYLTQHYAAYRSVRGDGNCYFRAFLYRLVELLSSSDNGATESQRLLTWLQTTSWEQVLNIGGYSEFAIEAFYDSLRQVLQEIVEQHKKQSTTSFKSNWHARFNKENDLSDYCTWYLRVLTATQLKAHAERFLPFIEDTTFAATMDMAAYCQRHVEPMGVECEMVSVAALAEALGVRVVAEYLDGRPLDKNKKLARHEFGPTTAGAALTIHVLYRPGHYDILYPHTSDCRGMG